MAYKNREDRLAYQRKYREANREKVNAWSRAEYQRNQERKKLSDRRYYESNKEKKIAQAKAWKDANKERAAGNAKKWWEANREKMADYKQSYAPRRRDMHLRKSYGISQDDYEAMYKKQGGRCAICGVHKKKLHVDHNHCTGKVRELLCHRCNTAIGLLYESPKNLKGAIKYLRKHAGDR